MKFCQSAETIMNITVLLLTPEKLWFVSPGTFRAKNTPFGAFSDLCFKCHFVCRERVFLWCWIQIYRSQYLKLHLPAFEWISLPHWLKNPQKPPNSAKWDFLSYNFSYKDKIYLKFSQNVDAIVLNIKLVLLTMTHSSSRPLGLFRA